MEQPRLSKRREDAWKPSFLASDARATQKLDPHQCVRAFMSGLGME
jgi:hypothetical protein